MVVGLTLTLPPATAPTPWLIDSDVAPVTFQASVEDPPAVIVAGVAVNDEITGALGGGFVVESPVVLPPQPNSRVAAHRSAILLNVECMRSPPERQGETVSGGILARLTQVNGAGSYYGA